MGKKSLSEIIDEINKEEELALKIIRLLQKRGKPLTAEVVSFVLEIPTYKACKSLKWLEKWGYIKKKTTKNSTYYSLIN